MTRFKKEMGKRFPAILMDEDESGIGAYVIEEEALIVFHHPGLVTVLRFLQNGKQRDVTDDYPLISAPYLVMLCQGDVEMAKRILKSNHF